MLYTVDFAVAGLILLIFLYIFLVLSYDVKNPTVFLLRRLVLSLIIADTFDIITCVTISFPYSVSMGVNYLLNIIFFESEVICISLFPKYIHAIINNSKNILMDRINAVIVFIYAIICASTPFTKCIFYFDENRTYIHGSLYVIIFAVPCYFLLFALFRMIFNHKSFHRKQLITASGFVLFAVLGPIMQALLPGNKIIDFFFLAIAALIAVMGLETPDFVKLERALKELDENKSLLENTLKREEERNKTIHEMTKSASWSITMDSNGNFIDAFWSNEFFWMLGYERDEISDQTSLWTNSLHPDDKEPSTEAFAKGLNGIEAYNITYRLKNKNGEYRWYRGTGELKIDPDNQTKSYHGIIQDINDQKIKDDLQKEKIAALEELEKSQVALREALVKAESADKAKSDFLANMSHEIRTPINAVLGMNELITRESTEPKILEYSANVSDAGNALLSLINDILDFSKIEAGKMELAPANYQLSVLLREVNNIMNLRFANKGLKFEIKNNPDIPNTLYGDEVRIRQVLINILNNALKYTDKGSVTLDINFKTIDSDNVMLEFSSIDTGIGIKEEDLPNLFKAFARIDLEKNRKKEGTGLGLSITHSFVELMGGTIDVTSKYGSGSTFTVSIPQKIIESKTIGVFNASNEATKKKAAYQASFTAKDAKILVVDDILINLEIIKGLLKQNGMDVETASSGKECLDAVVKTKYDIILLDHMMPELDGVETMKLIKADTTHPNQDTPFIMLTANAIIGAKEEYLRIGFTDYLSKPVQPRELDEMIIKYLPEEKVCR